MINNSPAVFLLFSGHFLVKCVLLCFFLISLQHNPNFTMSVCNYPNRIELSLSRSAAGWSPLQPRRRLCGLGLGLEVGVRGVQINFEACAGNLLAAPSALFMALGDWSIFKWPVISFYPPSQWPYAAQGRGAEGESSG